VNRRCLHLYRVYGAGRDNVRRQRVQEGIIMGPDVESSESAIKTISERSELELILSGGFYILM